MRIQPFASISALALFALLAVGVPPVGDEVSEASGAVPDPA